MTLTAEEIMIAAAVVLACYFALLYYTVRYALNDSHLKLSKEILEELKLANKLKQIELQKFGVDVTVVNQS